LDGHSLYYIDHSACGKVILSGDQHLDACHWGYGADECCSWPMQVV